MNVLRPLSFASLALLSSLCTANWTAMNVGASGCKSITTYNGAIYVAAYNVGVQKSTTDGASWTPANVGLPLSGVGGTQIKAQSVGRSATAIFCGTESGIYRSTDNAASWVIANSQLPAGSSTIYANKFYTFGGVTFAVFTGTAAQNGGGVFRTTDNGSTWLQGFSGLSANMTVYGIDQVDGILYAATNTSLMKSIDLGQSWTQAGTTNYAVYAVQGFAGRLVAITDFGARYSLDGGDTWTPSTNYPVAEPDAGSELISYDGKYYAITHSNSLGCYVTLDGGVTWTAFNDGLSGINAFGAEEFHASGNKLYIASVQDSFSAPGSTVGVGEDPSGELPVPYPTVFEDHFTLDLSSMNAGGSIVLIDATGREVARHGNLPATPVRIERSGLVSGRYHCMIVDPGTDLMRSLGSVIAR